MKPNLIEANRSVRTDCVGKVASIRLKECYSNSQKTMCVHKIASIYVKECCLNAEQQDVLIKLHVFV